MKSYSLKINNTKNAAIKTGKWSNPGAKFYDKLLNSHDSRWSHNGRNVFPEDEESKDWNYWEDFLKEAYLIAPVNDIKNSPHGRTPFSKSGCKYPHHVIKDGELVLSVPGVKAAYARAKQQGVYEGELKKHLERHIKELGDLVNFEEKIESNFDTIYEYILEKTGINLFDDIPENFMEIDIDEFIEDICSLDININNYYIEDTDESTKEDKKEEFVPIYGIIRSCSDSELRNDGTPKDPGEINSGKFAKLVNKFTKGDNYSHSLVSFDDSLTKMYSFNNATNGFEFDNIMDNDSWMGTKSIYLCVMFVKKEDKDKMEKFVKKLHENSKETRYPILNLLRIFVGKPIKSDKRFICSAFTGYVMSCANAKNLHIDYSRLRPDDITILPRAFYVMNVKDRQEFINRHSEIKSKVQSIYDEYYDEIKDYNNHLPKLMLQDKCEELRTLDKIYDWIVSKL